MTTTGVMHDNGFTHPDSIRCGLCPPPPPPIEVVDISGAAGDPQMLDRHRRYQANDPAADYFDPETDDAMWSPLFEEVWHNVRFRQRPNYRLLLKPDQEVPGGRWYFQIECDRPDAITGEPGTGRGGKAYLSPHATRSELVQTAFSLLKAYDEHEAREAFEYAGVQVFGPHFDVLALHGIADRTEHRGDPS